MSRRTAQKKDKKEMSNFEKFVTEGNEKADELAKAGAIWDERFVAKNESKDSPGGARSGKDQEKWTSVDKKK